MSLSLLLDLFCMTDYKNAPISPGNNLDLLREDDEVIEASYNAFNSDIFSKGGFFDGQTYSMLDRTEETPVDILEREIKSVDIKLLKMTFMGANDEDAQVAVSYESFTTIRKQTIQFRRVTLKKDPY